MIDAASLLELADFTCTRCGRRDPDTFTDMAGLEAALASPGQIPVTVAGPVPRGPLIRHLDLGALAQFGPVHRKCQPQQCRDCRGSGQAGAEQCARCRGTGRFNLLRTVG